MHINTTCCARAFIEYTVLLSPNHTVLLSPYHIPPWQSMQKSSAPASLL